ncbi:GNAT family N-acetyltransferase [Enterovirga rhinocerotis]|uniref:Ribosomal-protein-alanine N-acetyltransferase n=1 Tax=Enterovirga rhinocerotis TaxID=1339210 RepID=A0A4R7BPU4_9HYPH|nr:GNAT family N-acetyltransferase [Enterovirga rhinocerotis]TDR87163.1 ribosomal-protein-alanine N-acetyltransferase [Enterovirga rhinocerotis]
MTWLARLGLGRADEIPRVEALSVAHADRLAAIHGAAFARPWSAFDFEGFLADRSVHADGLFYGRARQPAGFVLSRLTLDEAEILSVALDAAARGRGHSRLLLVQHLQALAHAGAARVHLEVEEGNAPAFALYRRLGFAQSGLRPGYYARPDGSRATAVSMTKDLGGGTRP